MKKIRFTAFAVVLAMLVSGCASMSNTGKGAAIGGGGGAVLGGVLGALIGKDGKSTAIGAAIGGVVGAGVGTIIGHKMDKAKEAAANIDGADAISITDANGLPAVLVTFDSGLLFTSGSSTLSANAQNSLTRFAKVLTQEPTLAVAVLGHTDSQGWKNSTAAQSEEKNQVLSEQRAQAVANFLKTKGASYSQFKEVSGKGQSMPIASNSTAAGQAQNRRVEVYLYASEQMVKEAEQASR